MMDKQMASRRALSIADQTTPHTIPRPRSRNTAHNDHDQSERDQNPIDRTATEPAFSDQEELWG